MSRIRVLVVDNAVVVRRMLSDVLGADEAIEVVGVAANGHIALLKIPHVAPDLVVLDVEMPELDGLATLTEIRKTQPRLPIVMFSTTTERGAVATLDALARGATDYVTKPSYTGSAAEAQQRIREQLIPKIKALCGRSTVARPGPERPPPLRPARSLGGPVDVVAIGVSTGGPNALAQIIPALTADIPVPILIVQHMPPMFTALLAERLAAQAAIPVVEAVDGIPVDPGCAYIAPGDYHLLVERTAAGVVLRTQQGAPENSCRPSVDVLFRSCAAVWGNAVLGVVLTGMGQDGVRGSQAIVEAGGRVVAQDEATSVVWGMPGFVAAAGLAEAILPLPQIAADITRRALALWR